MKQKQGISLIVLVITIIVMIIIAASVVISLSSTGVIGKANQAVKLSDEKSVQDLAAIIWAECYLDGDRDGELITNVTTKLEEQGVTSAKWNIEASNKGVTVTPKKETDLITFTVGDKTLQAEQNMTWEEYIESEYNTDGFGIYEDFGTVITDDEFEINYNNSSVAKTEKIIANGVYTISPGVLPDWD